MLPNGLKVGARAIEITATLEGGDEIALEEICASGERDRVRDRAFQQCGGGVDDVEGFGNGGEGGGKLGKEEDKGFDGGDGHGDIRVRGEKRLVGCYNTGEVAC